MLTVVKVGGGLARDAGDDALRALCAEIGAAGARHRLLVVPGGGEFADAVRAYDRRVGLQERSAHWMAILAMDQYAYLIAERIQDGTIVETPRTIAAALKAGHVPVLAPFRWMRDADPLPHSWEVTSDSFAAWIAGELAATQVILIKPPGRRPEGLLYEAGDIVDPYFHRTLRAGIKSVVVAADQMDVLCSALSRS